MSGAKNYFLAQKSQKNKKTKPKKQTKLISSLNLNVLFWGLTLFQVKSVSSCAHWCV